MDAACEGYEARRMCGTSSNEFCRCSNFQVFTGRTNRQVWIVTFRDLKLIITNHSIIKWEIIEKMILFILYNVESSLLYTETLVFINSNGISSCRRDAERGLIFHFYRISILTPVRMWTVKRRPNNAVVRQSWNIRSMKDRMYENRIFHFETRRRDTSTWNRFPSPHRA
jgi:hypothetical protein